LLLSKGYEVVGLVRQAAGSTGSGHLHQLDGRVALAYGDLLEPLSLVAMLQEHRPHEVYNLAAQSFVPASWSQPVLTGAVTGLGAVGLLEAIRLVDPDIRYFQASSASMFGSPATAPQSELTPLAPTTPYGAAKAYAHWATVAHRERYGLHASTGIMFNHESERRGMEFVSRKVTRGAASIRLGISDRLHLGNLEARRDWGYAGDYVKAMWLMLQQDSGDDFVLSTDETHSVEELVEVAFQTVGLRWQDHVVLDESLRRRTGERLMVGDSSKARRVLGWAPEVGFQSLIERMVAADLARLDRGRRDVSTDMTHLSTSG
jgi:GDPmannose 4,6-dehydratase